MQKISSNISRVIIDPRCRINYASYYIEGLKRLIGKVQFRCLPEIKDEPVNGMAVKVVTAMGEKNVFFDCWDGDGINEEMYQWSDAYGKVNMHPKDAKRSKMVALGPNFGISLWNPVVTLVMAMRNFFTIRRAPGCTFKQPFMTFFRDYAYMLLRRKRYSYYYRFTREEQPGYFFSMSTLWWGELSFSTTNKYRGDFMRLCKRHMTTFDGGFFYVNEAERESAEYPHYLEEYSDMIYKHRLSMNEYDKRNRRSWFVFSTPSVIGCHGWKLGEFLCEGKAIVSTPLNNVMPGSFENGVHYLEVLSPDDMEKAIVRLRDDVDLMQRLKRNAWDYYNTWVSPEASVLNVLKKVGVTLDDQQGGGLQCPDGRLAMP